MLKSIPIFLTFYYVSAQLRETNEAILPISPEQIRHSFDNVMTDEYIHLLAKDFATKAAEHFVKEMSNQKLAMTSKLGQISRSPVTELSMETLQNQLQALQKAQPAAQALSQAQVQAKAAAMVQAQKQAHQKAQVEKQAQEIAKANAKAKAEAQLQAELEEKDVEVEDQPAEPTENQNNNEEMLESSEALNLLKEPEPDGDHLDSQSGELSKESAREKIPVIQVMKINGAYFRRLLGLI